MKRITIELDTSAMYPGIPRINEEAARILRWIADDVQALAMASCQTTAAWSVYDREGNACGRVEVTADPVDEHGNPRT